MQKSFCRHLGVLFACLLLWLPAWASERFERLKTEAVDYISAGQLDKAEANARLMLKLAESPHTVPTDAAQLITSLSMLAFVYDLQERYADAENVTARSLRVYEKSFGKDSNAICGILGSLARLYTKQGKLKKAEVVYERILAIKERAEPGQLTASLVVLGKHYDLEQKYEQAEASYKRALSLYEKQVGATDPALKPLLVHLTDLALKMGKKEEAQMYAARDADILD